MGSISRLIMRSEVVFPQPLGPTSTIVFPAGTSRSSASTATVPPGYRFVTRSNLIKLPPGPSLEVGISYRIYMNISESPGRKIADGAGPGNSSTHLNVVTASDPRASGAV